MPLRDWLLLLWSSLRCPCLHLTVHWTVEPNPLAADHWTSVTFIPSGTWKMTAPDVVSLCATLIWPLEKLV